MKKMFVFLIATLVAAGAFAAGSKAPPAGKSFTVALEGDIVSLDPAYVYDYTSGIVSRQIYETLLTYDENDNLIPWLAESWRAVDNLTYVYQLRGDVKFSDGTPMTVADVLFSIENVRKEEAYVSWMFGVVDRITQTGEREITVKLNSPSASWPYVLAATGGIISKAYYEKHPDDFGTAKGGIVGTGGFVFDHWTGGQEIVLKKNPNYWNKAAVDPSIETLTFKVIPDNNTRVTALRTGEVDYTPNPPLDLLPVIRADGNLNTITYGSFSVVFLAFNTQRAPFTDPNVRKAIHHALDLESLQRNLIKDAGSAGTVLPQGEALYGTKPQEWRDYLAKAPRYEFNLDKARDYLSRSPVPNGFSLKLITNEDSLRNAMALFIQDSLAKLNIKVEIVKVSDDEHTEYQFGGVLDPGGRRDYDLILAGWTADYPDIGNNIEPLYAADQAGEGGMNAAAYVNPRVDALIREENALTDVSARNRLIFQALDIITAEVPYIFITYPNRQVVHNRKWTGINIDSFVSADFFRFYTVKPR